jgi:ABC-type phosphate transport system ATPase subunit
MNDLIDGVKITGSISYENQNILDENIDVNQL